MSLLIADIGATSSRWSLLDRSGEVLATTDAGPRIPGFNAAGGESAPMVAGLRDWLMAAPVLRSAGSIMVYGAGCGSPERRWRMQEALASLWADAAITVETDLLGAARAAYGQGGGLILILGTGMNAGHFQDDCLTTTMPSLGYIIGDEGSGADIGKQLYRDVFQRRMPEDLRTTLFGPEGPDLGAVIAEVYRGQAPARFLAAQVGKLLPHLEDPYVHGMITTRFRKLSALLANFFPEEQRAQVAAVGSVAHGLRDLLGPCLAEQGMTLSAALADPMEGLVRYHRERSR
jgi:glucosamine kinase